MMKNIIMKKKNLTLLFFIALIFYGKIAVAEPLLSETNKLAESGMDICALVDDAESWLEGQLLGEGTLAMYFNTTQAEFIDFATAGSIEHLKVDLYWQPNTGSSIQLVQSGEIDNIYTGFNIGMWAMNIDNPDVINGSYQVRITINGVDCGALTALQIVEEEIIDEEEEEEIELPEYECGETYTYPPNTNTVGLSAAVSGEVFLIGGFPILLKTVSGGNGTFSGSGLIPLPFGNKVVKVNFSNVKVNTDREIYEGDVVAESDHPGNYPDFNIQPPPLEEGADICLALPPAPGYDDNGVNQNTGLNDWGFDPNTGINSETNGIYDRYGFDIYGNHEETQGPFNEQGCSREGLTIDGETCDPSGGPNPEATQFANSIASTIQNDIGGIIDELKDVLTDSLQKLDCPGIRTQLNTLIGGLGYNREFIFGESDQYLNEGMHLEFQSEPKPLVLNIERDANAKLLEERHVDLYHCDRASYAVNALLGALLEMGTPAGIGEIKEDILDLIKDWTTYESGRYKDDPDAFREWLIFQIGQMMKDNSGLDSSYVHAERPSTEEEVQSIFDFNSGNRSLYNSTASLDGNFSFNEGFTLDDADFFFRQGDQFINGVDRAFYLEGLARQQILTMNTENLLPIKVEKTVANRTYTIYLDEIHFSTSGARLNAYIIIEDPETGRRVVFKALNIGFGPTGTTTESKLELASDVQIRLNNAAMLILKGTTDTYVAWDCDGFTRMGIDAEIEFCRKFVVPLDPATLAPKPDPERYRLSFKVPQMSGWLEFSLELNAPPFTLAQYQDVKWEHKKPTFELTKMILDFDSEHTEQFVPLEGYASPFWDGATMAPQWKGFYMKELTATLPNEFSTGDDPIRVKAENLLIDGSGFSGGVTVGNLVNFEDGSLGGWPFSIDQFEVRILNNQFAGAGMGGQVKVPIFEERMKYEAVIYPGSLYKFSVSPTADVTADLFLATATVNENSKIEVSLGDDGFEATATLHGKLMVNTDNHPDAGISLDFPDLTFQNLVVTSLPPYIQSGTWGIIDEENEEGTENNFNGFGVRLSQILPHTPGDGTAGLKFQIDIELSHTLKVNATGAFDLVGEIGADDNGRQKWNFKEFNINALDIDASFPGAASVRGQLVWFGSETAPLPTWGKGFKGLLEVEFEGLDIGLKAAAQFGKVDGHKYFFIDALAELGALAPGIGVLQLKGFGGGISWRMRTNNEPVGLEHTSNAPVLPGLGQSFSGMGYIPDASKRLGLKAIAIVATLKEEIFNGTVSLSVTFGNNDQLEEMRFTGSGQFLKGLNKAIKPDFVEGSGTAPGTVNAALSAFVDLTYNFSEPSFHGKLQAFLNAGLIRGGGNGGKVIDAEVHFDPTQWYIYIGLPDEERRCQIIFDLPLVGDITASAYLDVGTNVPPMAPIPGNVRSIAYRVNDNASLRKSGAGFVFGAAINFDLSASLAGIVSAHLDATAGFDIMLRKYEGLHCQGSSTPVGIDGWYAAGQIYAYVYGELKAFGINIVSAGVAAVLQARLPNPFFAQATIGVKIKLLFVTIRKSLKLELGDDCLLV